MEKLVKIISFAEKVIKKLAKLVKTIRLASFIAKHMIFTSFLLSVRFGKVGAASVEFSQILKITGKTGKKHMFWYEML